MAYIIKNTSGLVNTRVTDTGRKKLSQGRFNVAYFQIGDSEVSYDKLPTNYNYSNSFVLEPAFNSQNSAGVPESNRQNIKYPYYVDGSSGSTYGIPYMDSTVDPVYNRAPLRGFFSGNTTAQTITWSALTNDQYVVTSNYVVDMSTLNGSNKIDIIYSGCNTFNIKTPSIGDFITIYYDGNGKYNCECTNLPSPTPTPTPTITPTISVTPTITPTISVTPTITPTISVTPTTNVPVQCNCYEVTNNSFEGELVEYIDCENTVRNIFLTVGENVILCSTVEPYNVTRGTVTVSLIGQCINGVCVEIPPTPTPTVSVSPSPGSPECICYNVQSTGGADVLITNCDGIEEIIPLPGSRFGIDICSRTFPVELSGSIVVVVGLPCVGGLCPVALDNQIFGETTTPTPTPTPSVTKNYDPCASPTPTPTPSKTPCLTPTPSRLCPAPPPPTCLVPMNSCYQILTYRILDVCENTLTLDRNTPDFCGVAHSNCLARTLVYPPNMTSIYDSITPNPHWGEQVIDFESICDTDQFDVKIWNMNIPWTENPAGMLPSKYEGYEYFGSIDYIGSKEYFGYNSSSGQKFFINNTLSAETTDTFFYNSLGEVVKVLPEEQKSIAIVHYTNQTIDFFYGEKFALEPYDPSNPDDTTGQARNFKVHIPWLMWHKNPQCCFGQTFWVDPPGFDNLELFKVRYIQTTKNDDMNNPGIRYYHLWDTNKNIDGMPNRVGKVFPDSKLIIIDDEELVAAMSYKSNRNWTLPAPQLSLITPNTCGQPSTTAMGVLTGHGETMYVTYRFTNNNCNTNSLHSNYYVKQVGNNNDCTPNVSQNVAVRFGREFNCLGFNNPVTTTTTFNPLTTTTTENILTTTTTFIPITTTTTTICPPICDIPQGFFAERFEIIAQKVPTGQRPNPSNWKIIDYTNTLSLGVTQDSLTSTTFVITKELYDKAPYYDLGKYINLTRLGNEGVDLNFGDEYYFYGSLETDIMATIYEMKYKINLSFTEFLNTTNPSWTPGTNSYVTEIALLDEEKNVLVMSKLQSPVLRQGIQQYLVKIDF